MSDSPRFQLAACHLVSLAWLSISDRQGLNVDHFAVERVLPGPNVVLIITDDVGYGDLGGCGAVLTCSRRTRLC